MPHRILVFESQEMRENRLLNAVSLNLEQIRSARATETSEICQRGERMELVQPTAIRKPLDRRKREISQQLELPNETEIAIVPCELTHGPQSGPDAVALVQISHERDVAQEDPVGTLPLEEHRQALTFGLSQDEKL